MSGDPQAMGAERSHRAPPASHSRSAPASWVLATASWITTVDHKRIGILYGVTAFAFFLLGGLEALLIRLQLAAPDAHVVSAETYNALFTMHGTTMVFLAIMPLNAAFFNYMVPLLIGARDVAFPRLNALSYWILLFGGLFLNASFLVGTPPDVGWFGYANLTSKQFSPSHSVDFWLLSLQLLGVSSMFGAPVVVYSGVLIGFFGFGVWSHHMFAAGMGPVADAAFSIATMLIAIPTGVKIFNWLATLWGGSIRATTAFHFAVGLVGLFTIGGLSGIMHASPPVDLQQTDSYFVVAHLHYVLIGGSLFGLFAGAYYWWPKITGRLLGEGLGRLHFWVLFAGFNLAFFPQHYLGALGMPRRIYTYAPDAGWTTTNFASTVGAFGIGVGVLLFMINAWRSLRRGAPALADPWDGRTLEWRTSSPPPAHDFDTIPPIYGRDTYWREKYGRPRGGQPAPGPGAAVFHLPSPSHWPVVIAFGMGMAAVGALTHVSLVLVGGLLTVFGVFRLALEHHR